VHTQRTNRLYILVFSQAHMEKLHRFQVKDGEDRTAVGPRFDRRSLQDQAVYKNAYKHWQIADLTKQSTYFTGNRFII